MEQKVAGLTGGHSLVGLILSLFELTRTPIDFSFALLLLLAKDNRWAHSNLTWNAGRVTDCRLLQRLTQAECGLVVPSSRAVTIDLIIIIKKGN